jgi:hypothetical protein
MSLSESFYEDCCFERCTGSFFHFEGNLVVINYCDFSTSTEVVLGKRYIVNKDRTFINSSILSLRFF